MRLLDKIWKFSKVDIWENNGSSKIQQWGKSISRKILVSCRYFFLRGHMDYATQLSFSTILALVPILAMFFAVGRAFGLSMYVDNILRQVFKSQPQVADELFTMADSYLNQAQTGILIGLGILVMLYSILSLIRNIEMVFDIIWHVDRQRSVGRLIIDYTAMIFLIPVILIILSSTSVLVFGVLDRIPDFLLLDGIFRFLIRVVSPWLLLTAVFIGVNMYVPNTHVKLSCTIIPSMFASAFMLALQYFYIHGQIFLTSYNAIYGSFAVIPLFMIWMLASWYIILFFGELCYANQNDDYYAYFLKTSEICHYDLMIISGLILAHISQAKRNENKALSAIEITHRIQLPIRIVLDVLDNLRRAGLLQQYVDLATDKIVWESICETDQLSMGKMVYALDNVAENTDTKLVLKSKIPHDNLMIKKIAELYSKQIKQWDSILVRDLI
ncbi:MULTISPECIES: YihY/virulence factor BrkB family protein [Segatella]|jgi:membrane protein|uniref:YihY family protein n=3 Tax=Segatella TaxID=2974251 RepID=D8DWS0_9BACT|nr:MULTISPECIES: YihY/virulence factor BrkB family protein [Segatella]EFI72138.1 YihY family protein [Segatella baroniae B14]OYP54744.1 YihY/virulence factor BrkB family protein [Segatella bryantii]UKK77036.1 YihY/virulence factor BrkB family protein [Segatella bryantii]UKK78637.1 YihY/virulence factor BrkB family protein [Segatella baroniae B14]UKK81669.1 YihY/virulence factor BrkB family protein [Segatella bryantii]